MRTIEEVILMQALLVLAWPLETQLSNTSDDAIQMLCSVVVPYSELMLSKMGIFLLSYLGMIFPNHHGII